MADVFGGNGVDTPPGEWGGWGYAPADPWSAAAPSQQQQQQAAALQQQMLRAYEGTPIHEKSMVDMSGTIAFPVEPESVARERIAMQQARAEASHHARVMRSAPIQQAAAGFGQEPSLVETTTTAADGGSMLGLALLLVGVSAAVGVHCGGAYGGVAGALYGGAAVNGIRAVKNMARSSPEATREAIASGTYAVLGAGVATWLAFRAHEGRRPVRANSSHQPTLGLESA